MSTHSDASLTCLTAQSSLLIMDQIGRSTALRSLDIIMLSTYMDHTVQVGDAAAAAPAVAYSEAVAGILILLRTTC